MTGGILGIQRWWYGRGGGWQNRRTAWFEPGGWGGVAVGQRLPRLQSHTFEWVCDWVSIIAALHHAIYKVEEPSLDGIWHHHSDRPHQSSTNGFPSCFLVSSQSTILLRLLPPYTPRNETSIFVGSYGSYHVWSPHPGFPPPRLSNVSISPPNWVSEFSSYRDINYAWNLEFDALVYLPCLGLRSDKYSLSQYE